jgi:uncharacterized protein YndB with AHSA1/START domain
VAKEHPVGLTKSVGYQVGARRTLPVRLEKAWQLVLLPEAVDLWLGPAERIELKPRVKYQLADGTAGEVRVFHPGSHLRITRQPTGWLRSSTIQVRVVPRGERTTVAFHEEHLPDATERERRRAQYHRALDGLEWLVERLYREHGEGYHGA